MTSLRRAVQRRQRGQRGETLIEILFTVFVMSTVLITLLGLMVTVVAASATHRGAVAAGNQATTISEAIDRLPYVVCGTSSNYSSAVGTLPTGYTGSIVSVRYLQDGSSPTATYVSSCPGGVDQGAQLVTIQVQRTVPPVAKATVELVKRDVTCPANLGSQLQPNQTC